MILKPAINDLVGYISFINVIISVQNFSLYKNMNDDMW